MAKNTNSKILVVGSVGLDSVETPFGKVEEVVGGSATYFSISSSFFVPVNLVAVVGKDFSAKHLQVFDKRKIDLSGLQKVDGKTFRWKGYYGYDLNNAQTLDTQLNVFEKFEPKIPVKYQDSGCVFLANIDPELQLKVLKQVKKPWLTACDTMNFWIERKPESVKNIFSQVDIVVINEAEVRQLAKESNLIKATREILALGTKAIVVKKGEYGVSLFTKNFSFCLPAYPLEKVFDPTGAGDTFAGGFIGSLTKSGQINATSLRQAVVYGSVMASFNVEDFSMRRLQRLTSKEIKSRFNEFKKLTYFC